MRIAFIVVLTAIMLPAFGAPVAAKDLKIGYVEMARAFRELDDLKAADAKLKKDFGAKQKQIDTMQTAIKKKQEDFEKRSGVMKADVKQQKQQELQREFANLQQTYIKLQDEIGKAQQTMLKTVSDKVRRIVERIGDREGYDMVLEVGAAVLYYKKHQDVTDQVIREYNREYGKK